MPRKSAGSRYPHATTDARPHDHSMCGVTNAIAELARAGSEPWGTEHDMPLLTGTEDEVSEIRRKLFLGRRCVKLARIHGALSVSVTYRRPDGTLQNSPPVRLEGGYQLVVRVWGRALAKKELARRVDAGEKLAYNVYRQETT